MRRFQYALLTIVAVVGLASIASAADMPTKAPVYKAVPAAPLWTGWYIGIAGGAGWGRVEQTDATPFDSGRYNTRGGLIGGVLGYNWQSGAAVFGLETDLSWASIKGATTGTDPFYGTCGGLPPNCDSKITALGTVRGRLGYAWQNLLPYVTGGLAYADVHGSEGDVAAHGAFGSGSKWVAGWTVGGGLEGIIAPNWTAKIEYLYVDLGNRAVFTDTIGGVAFDQSLRESAHVLRVGVNYRFAK